MPTAQLRVAAIQLTVERGFDNVRVEDIAEAAGVSPRTFNNYFSSKSEAIVSRHLDRCLRLAEELRRRPVSEPLWESVKRVALMLRADQPVEMEQLLVEAIDQLAAGLPTP